MFEDVNCRRKVAKEVFELLSEAAQVIKDDPAFFEVYMPVKVILKVNIISIFEFLLIFLEFQTGMQECGTQEVVQGVRKNCSRLRF
jgi:hypothetical protein